jgi:hypothetical protein
VRLHITNVASLETILSENDGQRALSALAKQYNVQLADNERQLSQINDFKASLYENMISGLLSKEDYKTLKAKYSGDESRLRGAIEKLQDELNEVLSGNSERLRWTEHFKRFEGLTTLDRRCITNLIQNIKVVSKTEMQVTFNYQAEYETALNLLKQEVA